MRKTSLLILSFILLFTFRLPMSTQQALAADYEYSQVAKDALVYINIIRSEAGLSNVELDPVLAKSAENHANYLKLNGHSEYHVEVDGKNGFTGARIRDRINAVGGVNHKYKLVGEGVTYGFYTAEEALEWLFNAPYHRTNLIDPSLEKVGVGLDGQYFSISYSTEREIPHLTSTVYPFNGQKDVNPVFLGNETPDPLEGTGIEQSGYIVSQSSYNGETINTATIEDEMGVTVPVVIKNKERVVQGWYFNIVIPESPLKEGMTYKVTINGKVSTFTTVGKALTQESESTEELEPTHQHDSISSEGKYILYQFNKNNVGIKLNNSFMTLNPTAKVVKGNTFIPLRGVLENMGTNLIWDGKLQTVTITKDSTVIKLEIGSKTVQVNGKLQALSVAPYLEKGYTFVPLRFISEALGANVSWDATECVASIDTSNTAGHS